MKNIFLIISLAFSFQLFTVSTFSASKQTKNLNKIFPYKPGIHKEINSKMFEKALKKLQISVDSEKTKRCEKRLIRSQTLQDFFLIFLSKGHFDNCAFSKSINYINRLQIQNEGFAKEMKEENEPDDEAERKLLKRKILFNTGKILHAIQDFYAHSNYVELMELQHPELSEVPVLKFWENKDQDKILQMRSDLGLITGTAWWVFPKKCKKGSPPHKKLAKDADSKNFEAGQKPTIWTKKETTEKLNRYEAALFLAEESTYQFLLHTFNKYPMLKEHCGNL
jgi:hypothetical protein